MRIPDWRKRLRLQRYGGQASFEDAVARRRVKDFIADMRLVCEEEGPHAFRDFVEAPDGAEARQIAYLLTWREGPKLEVWEWVERFDAADLAVDAAAEGFQAYLAAHAEA